MWSDRRTYLDMRQQQLVAQSHALRERLLHEAQPLERPLAFADRMREGARWLVHHPAWLAAAALALPVLLRPGRSLVWGLKLWGGWRMWRRVQPLIAQALRR